MYLPDAVSVVALQKTAWVQRKQLMCFNNISFRSSVLELSKLPVPKCGSQLCILCATVLLVQMMWWRLLCSVGPGWDW